MPGPPDSPLLDALLDSWDRNNEVMVNLLRVLPEGGLDVPAEEWAAGADPERIARWLTESARVVREAVRGRVLAGRDLDLHYGHPVGLIQLLLWHEGYHHGQIKLALKLAGRPIPDDVADPATWAVWRAKR